MNDEGNVVVEAAPVVSEQPTINNDTDITVINQQQSTPSPQAESITEPVAETTAQDIGVVEQHTTPIPEVKPMIGSQIDEVQIIEMMDQRARSNIYGREQLQKAGFDSEIATALAYNESKHRALAIDEYYISLSRSFKEAELTGYYMAPEDKDMLTQKNMANYQLGLEGNTNALKTQALKTIATVDNYFKAKGISPPGIQTLDRIVKMGELSIMRGKNAAAAGQLQNMIKAQQLADIQTIYASIETGASREEIKIRFDGIIDPRDIDIIYDSYSKALGGTEMAEGWMNSLGDKDLLSKTKLIKKLDDGNQIRSFKRDGINFYMKSVRNDLTGVITWEEDPTFKPYTPVDKTKVKQKQTTFKINTDLYKEKN